MRVLISAFMKPTSARCPGCFSASAFLSVSVLGLLLSGLLYLGLLLPSPALAVMSLGQLQPNTPIQISADQQQTNIETNETLFTGNVVVYYGPMEVRASKASLGSGPNGNSTQVARFYNRPLLKQFEPGYDEPNLVEADQLTMDMLSRIFEARGNVDTTVKTVAQGPVTVRSDVQQFDNAQRKVSALGNVRVRLPDTQVQSRKAVMKLSPKGDAERAVFVGDVTLEQERNTIQSERLTVLVANKNLVAEQNVRTLVKNPSDGSTIRLTSDYQQFDNQNNTILASGRVVLVYGSYRVTGPKATFKLKQGAGSTDIDHILLSGRPTIVDGPRKITADTILITTNPRNFNAQGNVKTRFVGQPSAKASSASKAQASAAASSSTKASASAGGLQPLVTEEDELLLDD